jgi:hypothetical protein
MFHLKESDVAALSLSNWEQGTTLRSPFRELRHETRNGKVGEQDENDGGTSMTT